MCFENLYSDFVFKGDRQYVHGTSIYDFLLENVGGGGGILQLDLMFYHLAKRNLCFTIDKPKDLTEILCVAKFKDEKRRSFKVFGIEYEKEITKRIPYDESVIIKEAIFNGEEASVSKNSQYSFIEHLVSLNKSSLSKIFDDIKGKFYFSRLELKNGFIKDFETIRLCFKTHFNYQLMQSVVSVDGQEVGQIYFSCK
ncbi:hypothetical protein [Helicobacter rodentium]|uniref:hypothetical protein n=1 Tax=Helicobacter rodentium TaxID=59617 RepID=UPI0004793EFB|nr:hypothetical protein [Helicobacter rodentium]